MQCGYNYEEIYYLFKKYSKKIKCIESKNLLKAIYGLAIKRKIIIKGLNDGTIIEELINEACNRKGIYKIKQIKMPLLIPSVDLNTGDIYCFSSKRIRKTISNNIIYVDDIKIGKAVRASCSYPVIFAPYTYDGLELADGGLRGNVPWKETKILGADKVVSVIFEKDFNEGYCKNIVDVVGKSIDILNHELTSYELQDADYLLKIKTKNISLLDMNKIDELYEEGYFITKEHINEIKQIIKKN